MSEPEFASLKSIYEALVDYVDNGEEWTYDDSPLWKADFYLYNLLDHEAFK